MAHPLFELTAEAVTWPVVRDFLSLELRETFSVEYKERLNTRALETLVAMGNTYGGIVVVGVASNGDLPGEVVGVQAADRERLVNMLITQVDPPWAPEVLAVPVGQENKDRVVLICRVQGTDVPRPLILGGVVHVRSEGRNVPAGRATIAALLAEPAATRYMPLRRATRGPLNHAAVFKLGTDDDDPGLVLRAITSLPRPVLNEVRPRASLALREALLGCVNAADLTDPLDVFAAGHRLIPSAWVPGDVYDSSRRLTLSRSGTVDLTSASTPVREAELVLRAVADLGGTLGSSPELRVDLVAAPPSPRLGAPSLHPTINTVAIALARMAELLNDVLVPAALQVLVGSDLPRHDIEVHVQGRPHSRPNQPELRDYLDLEVLGPLQRNSRPSGGGEVLRRDLVATDGWEAAVREALTVIALDWGYPDAEVGLGRAGRR